MQYKPITTSLKLTFFCVVYSVILCVMTKHYGVMIVEMKPWIFVTSAIIIDNILMHCRDETLDFCDVCDNY